MVVQTWRNFIDPKEDTLTKDWPAARQLFKRAETGRKDFKSWARYTPGFTPQEIRRLRLVCQPTDGGGDVNGGILNHDGCVNTCHWTQDGALLLTGSDDRCVNIWDSNAGYKLVDGFPTLHTNNIFDIKTSPLNTNQVFTCAADGTLRMFELLEEGMKTFHRGISRRRGTIKIIGRSNSIMHGFEFWLGGPGGGQVIFTAQDDGYMCRYDLRERAVDGRVVLGRREPRRGRPIPIKAVAMPDPANASRGISPYMICVGGLGPYLEVYDIRRLPSLSLGDVYNHTTAESSFPSSEAIQVYRPSGLPPEIDKYYMEADVSISGLTYSKARPEILCSYQGDGIYAFNTEDGVLYDSSSGGCPLTTMMDGGGPPPTPPSSSSAAIPAAIRETYSLGGHLNSQTFLKTVKYFGPAEEYVVTGSDSGHVWVFDRRKGTVVNLLYTDGSIANGCIPHPFTPTLACYGIENAVKVFDIGAKGMPRKVKEDGKGEEEDDEEEGDRMKGAPIGVRSARDKYVVGDVCIFGSAEVLEHNMSRVFRPGRKPQMVCDHERFRATVRRLRSVMGERGEGGGLPDYPSDLTEENAKHPCGRALVKELTLVKEKGNAYFKEGTRRSLFKAALCYAKVLRWLRWVVMQATLKYKKKKEAEAAAAAKEKVASGAAEEEMEIEEREEEEKREGQEGSRLLSIVDEDEEGGEEEEDEEGVVEEWLHQQFHHDSIPSTAEEAAGLSHAMGGSSSSSNGQAAGWAAVVTMASLTEDDGASSSMEPALVPPPPPLSHPPGASGSSAASTASAAVDQSSSKLQEGMEEVKGGSIGTAEGGEEAEPAGGKEEEDEHHEGCHEQKPPEQIGSLLWDLRVSCLLNLSACALQQGQYEIAHQLADVVLGIDANHPKALFRRASASLALGDAEEAVKDLTRAHQLQKQDRALARKLVEARKVAQNERERNRRTFSRFFQDDSAAGSSSGGGAAAAASSSSSA